MPDDLDWTTKHELEGSVDAAFGALETVAAEDPEGVLTAFEAHGGIESVAVPGWSDRLSDLRATLEACRSSGG